MAGRVSRPSAAESRCLACRAPIFRQVVDVLRVTADAAGLTPEEEAKVRQDRNRLAWCLHLSDRLPAQLRWIHSWHPADCPHPHVACHRCPPIEPTVLF